VRKIDKRHSFENYSRRGQHSKGYLGETLSARQCHISFPSTRPRKKSSREYLLSRDTKGGVRGTRSRQPIEEERRTANQASPARCACTRSRVYGGIKEGAVALVRSLGTARRPVANQRRVATVHRPTADYRFSASRLPNSRRSPPRDHTLPPPSGCRTAIPTGARNAGDHARAFLTRDITYRADSRHARRRRKMVAP